MKKSNSKPKNLHKTNQNSLETWQSLKIRNQPKKMN